jgi:hypothetical protein
VRKWIHALTLMLTLSSAPPSGASILSVAGSNDLPGPPIPASAPTRTGVDGPLAPDTDYILPYRADGIFDFSLIGLGTGITLRFDPMTQSVKLFSQGNILIAGRIDAPGINLALETPEQLIVTGSILAGSISLRANIISLAGELGIDTVTTEGNTCRLNCDPLMPRQALPTAQGTILIHDRGYAISAVPEPATLWLFVTILPLLALSGRKRKAPGMA